MFKPKYKILCLQRDGTVLEGSDKREYWFKRNANNWANYMNKLRLQCPDPLALTYVVVCPSKEFLQGTPR